MQNNTSVSGITLATIRGYMAAVKDEAASVNPSQDDLDTFSNIRSLQQLLRSCGVGNSADGPLGGLGWDYAQRWHDFAWAAHHTRPVDDTDYMAAVWAYEILALRKAAEDSEAAIWNALGV